MDSFEGLDAFIQVGNAATEISANASVWAGNFLALIILTGIMLVFALRGGRVGLISLIIALYMGYAVYVVFPYREAILGAAGEPLIKAGLSVALFAAGTILPYILIRRFTGGGFGILSFFTNLILAALSATFLMALGYHVFDISNIYTFSAPLNQLFEPEGYFFYWFIAPLLGLFFLIH